MNGQLTTAFAMCFYMWKCAYLYLCKYVLLVLSVVSIKKPILSPIRFSFLCYSEAAAHAVATLAEATLQGGGQIVLSGETAAAVGALTGVQDANGKNCFYFNCKSII